MIWGYHFFLETPIYCRRILNPRFWACWRGVSKTPQQFPSLSLPVVHLLLCTKKGYNWGDFTNTRTYTMVPFHNSSVSKQSNCNSYISGPMVSVSSFSMSDGCGTIDLVLFPKSATDFIICRSRILCNGCTLDQVPWDTKMIFCYALNSSGLLPRKHIHHGTPVLSP